MVPNFAILESQPPGDSNSCFSKTWPSAFGTQLYETTWAVWHSDGNEVLSLERGLSLGASRLRLLVACNVWIKGAGDHITLQQTGKQRRKACPCVMFVRTNRMPVRCACCWPCCTMRFENSAKVLAECKLKYYRISECAGVADAACHTTSIQQPRPNQALIVVAHKTTVWSARANAAMISSAGVRGAALSAVHVWMRSFSCVASSGLELPYLKLMVTAMIDYRPVPGRLAKGHDFSRVSPDPWPAQR